jgi:tetratricopeptide (TPR) repeat protein
MQFLRRFRGLALCLLGGMGAIAQADNTFTLGTDSDLSEGALALFAKDYERGIELTLQGLKQQVAPQQRTAALSNLCAGYVGAERYDEAEAACSEAIELRDSNWRAFNNRAIALLGQGNYEAARSDVARGLQLHPESRQLIKVREMIDRRAPLLLAETD